MTEWSLITSLHMNMGDSSHETRCRCTPYVQQDYGSSGAWNEQEMTRASRRPRRMHDCKTKFAAKHPMMLQTHQLSRSSSWYARKSSHKTPRTAAYETASWKLASFWSYRLKNRVGSVGIPL